MQSIESFQGKHRFLSNFWPARVKLDDVEYPTVENAYQAAKTLSGRHVFLSCRAGDAKRLGRGVTLRPDWEAVKVETMRGLLRQKFAAEPLRSMLIETGDARLVEGNTWGDRFWGVCGGAGQNMLGHLLMSVRDELNGAAK